MHATIARRLATQAAVAPAIRAAMTRDANLCLWAMRGGSTQ